MNNKENKWDCQQPKKKSNKKYLKKLGTLKDLHLKDSLLIHQSLILVIHP